MDLCSPQYPQGLANYSLNPLVLTTSCLISKKLGLGLLGNFFSHMNDKSSPSH